MKTNKALQSYLDQTFPPGSSDRLSADKLLTTVAKEEGDGAWVILYHNNELDSYKWHWSVCSAHDKEFWWNSLRTIEEARKWCRKMGFKVIELTGRGIRK